MEHWLRRLSPNKQNVHEERPQMSSVTQSDADPVSYGFDSLNRLISIVVFILGLIVLFGWLFNLSALLTLVPSSQPMAVSSALAFLCLGASIWSRSNHGVTYAVTRSLVLGIGAVAALSHAVPIEHFIGHLMGLIRGPFASVRFPLRMSFIASLNFCLLGAIGISEVVFPGIGGILGRQVILVLLGFLTLLSAIGLLYSIALFRSFGFEKEISIASTVCFCLLYLAEIFQRPQEGLMLSLLDRSVSGKVVRRILLFVFITPIVVGGFVAVGNKGGLLDSMQAILLTVVVTLLPLSILVIGQGRVILRSERGLYENWKRYHELFEHIFDGVMVFREGMSAGEFFLTEINDSAAALLGANSHEVLGKEIREAFPCMLETPIIPAMQEAQHVCTDMKLGRIRCIRQGSPIWLNGSVYPFSSGKIVLVVDNITAQSQAEESMRDLARFPDESPSPILRVSLDGELLYANHSARLLLASWAVTRGGKIPLEHMPELLQAWASGENRGIEVREGKRVFSLTIAPILSSGYINLYGKDVTEEKSLAEKFLQAQKMEAIGNSRVASPTISITFSRSSTATVSSFKLN